MRAQLWCDFETGGVETFNHSPLSCALIAVKDGKIIGEWYTQIRQTPFVVTEEAMKINKLNLDDPGLTYQEFRKEYFRRVNHWFYGGTNWKNSGKNFYPSNNRANKNNMPLFCGHNTTFDKQVLQRILGGSPTTNVFDGVYYHRLDTMILANMLVDCSILPLPENFRLETLCKVLDVEPEENGEFHNALVDLKMTLKAYIKMKNILTDKQMGILYDDNATTMDDGPDTAAFLGEAQVHQ